MWLIYQGHTNTSRLGREKRGQEAFFRLWSQYFYCKNVLARTGHLVRQSGGKHRSKPNSVGHDRRTDVIGIDWWTKNWSAQRKNHRISQGDSRKPHLTIIDQAESRWPESQRRHGVSDQINQQLVSPEYKRTWESRRTPGQTVILNCSKHKQIRWVTSTAILNKSHRLPKTKKWS